MASEKQVIQVLENNVYMTTGAIYKAIGGTYPLIRLVQSKKIKCVYYNGRNHYFLQRNRDKLPDDFLRAGKMLKGKTVCISNNSEMKVRDLKSFLADLSPTDCILPLEQFKINGV